MKRTFKKILCSLLVVVMCITSAPLQGFVDISWFDFSVKASALTITGQCGENVFWNYNSETGELIISGSGAMYDYLYNSPFYRSDIRSIVFENGITKIGNYAFYNCDSLTSVTIPDSVTTIGDDAFASCDSLTSVTIPDSVTTIGEWAFASCDSLTSVTIPDSVTTIGDEAFYSCGSLTSVTIPDSVTTIGVYAFAYCGSLTSVTIPDSVTTIGEWAFYFCDSLTSVTIPDSVTTIGNRAFNCCYSLTSVTIPDSVTTIGNRAFASCISLTSVTIPDSVTSIGDVAFAYCDSLTSIVVDINNSAYSNDSRGVLFNKNKTILIQYPAGNTGTSYTIPDSVTTIGEGDFASCDSLTSVTIPDSVTSIGYKAFYGCDSLTSVTIPDSVTTIGDSAFYYCDSLTDVYYKGTEEQWNSIKIGSYNQRLTKATIHYNCKLPQDSYFTVSSDQYSVDSINSKENATYKVHLLDQNSDFLPVDNVTVQNNTEYIIDISTKKVSDTELELTVKPLSNGDASISLFNGDNSNPQYFNFTVYSNTTTYRADQVPVTNQELKTNFSRGDMTVDNFEYIFDENKGKYIATMDVYNRSGAIGVVAAYTQDGLISDIEQVDPYVPLPGDFGEFLVYLGTGAVSILKGENWNYRYSGYCQKTPIEIEVPEDGYLTVSCDISADEAVLIYNTVSLGVKTAFKTAEIIDYLGTDTDELAKEASKTIVRKTSEYFKSKKGKDWVGKALSKISKKMSKQFSVAYLEEMSMLSFDMLEEICQNIGTDFSTLFFEVIDELIQEEIKSFGVMSVSKKLIKDKVIGVAERNLMKVASAIFEGGEYINFANELLGTYLYNTDTGKTMIVFKPKGEDGFICKDTIKVRSDVITDEVLLHTYIIKDTQKEDAFVRKTIYSDFNRGDGLRKEELSIDLNRIVEIHEISLWKNGQEIFDTFTATVEMNLPSYIDRRTCSIYRVEKDGTYTKLDTRIEGNKIIFETDHFSEYILTGVIEDLQETTPCDVHVYDEVRTEPSCTEPGKIVYTCYCGDTYISDYISETGHNYNGFTCADCGKKCSCNCHKGGIMGFFFKIILFFQRIFKTNKTCACGIAHY